MSMIVKPVSLFGATQLENGQVRFSFWAPAQETVSVAIESGDLLPMNRTQERSIAIAWRTD